MSLHKLINTPYSASYDLFLEKKEIFKNKYQNEYSKILLKNDYSVAFLPYLTSSDQVQIGNIKYKIKQEDVISEIRLTDQHFEIKPIKLGNIEIFPKVVCAESYARYIKQCRGALLNEIYDTCSDLTPDHRTSLDEEVEIIKKFIEMPVVQKDYFFHYIKDDLQKSMNLLEEIRDVIYFWNLLTLLAHLDCFCCDSSAFIYLLIE